MPTYDYRCDGCGHRFELFQSIKADPAKTCPACGEEKARREIGAGGGLIFKGAGFYITDYTRSKDYKDKAKSESSSGAAPAAPAGGGAKSEPPKPGQKPSSSDAPKAPSSGSSSAGTAA